MAAWLHEDIHLCQALTSSHEVSEQVLLAGFLARGERTQTRKRQKMGPSASVSSLLNGPARWEEEGAFPCLSHGGLLDWVGLESSPVLLGSGQAWTLHSGLHWEERGTGLRGGPTVMCPKGWWHVCSCGLSPLLGCRRWLVHTCMPSTWLNKSIAFISDHLT